MKRGQRFTSDSAEGAEAPPLVADIDKLRASCGAMAWNLAIDYVNIERRVAPNDDFYGIGRELPEHFGGVVTNPFSETLVGDLVVFAGYVFVHMCLREMWRNDRASLEASLDFILVRQAS